MTIAELAAAGIASVLVPYPHAVDDHQSSNARFLSAQDAAILIPQAELSAAALANIIIGLSRKKLLEMAIRARQLGKPQAAAEVAQHCMELAK